jgi:subtilisin family serine protease
MDFSPGRAWPGRAGRGIRVAVIDSGVNTAHPHIGGVAGGVAIGAAVEADYLDVLGHGTAVMAAIMEKAPEAEYFAVKVFQTSLRARVEDILAAIDWCVDHEMHVMNLSLGTANPSHAERFAPSIARAAERGMILVSAGNALPGSLPGVIGAGLDWDCPRESYTCRKTAEGVEFRASGYPRSIPGVPRERNLSGMSFAVANLTGFVALACEKGSCSCASICSALSREAARITVEPGADRIR